MRTAVVGVGYLGTFHAQKYKAIADAGKSNCEFVGVCDLNADQAQKLAVSLSVKSFSKVQDLVGHVDAVTIATITPTHYELTKFFLENGIHVNVEKPICLKVSEAQELVELARKKSLVLCVGHSERFNPAFQELLKKKNNPSYVEFNRYAPFKLRGSDVSVLHDLMIHDLDLMLTLDSSPYKLVSASGGKIVTKTYDWCSASFQFESGLVCQVNSSRLNRDMNRSVRMIDSSRLYLANLQTGDFEMTQAIDHPEQPVSHQVVNVGRGDNLLSETQAFINRINSVKDSLEPVTGEAGMKALVAVEMILENLKKQNGV